MNKITRDCVLQHCGRELNSNSRNRAVWQGGQSPLSSPDKPKREECVFPVISVKFIVAATSLEPLGDFNQRQLRPGATRPRNLMPFPSVLSSRSRGSQKCCFFPVNGPLSAPSFGN